MTDKFLTKEYVTIFTWNNSKYVENRCSEVKINGRTYLKMGKLQSVTLAAVVHKIDSPSNKPEKYLITIGYSKQNTNDRFVSADIGEEVAIENAYVNPVISMVTTEWMREQDIVRMIKNYYTGSIHETLQFVKTREEVDIADACKAYYEHGLHLSSIKGRY